MLQQNKWLFLMVVAWLSHEMLDIHAFQSLSVTTSSSSSKKSYSGVLTMVATSSSSSENTEQKKKEGYVPKWTKKKTLADENGGNDMNFADKGIKGSIAVLFQQGNETKRSMAFPGQPVRDVATQAGQFIKYGCGKGECGTCEALCNGKWIRPCTAVVPSNIQEGQEYIIQVKDVKNKSKSSGKFFSIKSFFMGFYNNLLGMVGFVKYRRNAKKNWDERQEYENLIRQKTLEKKLKRKEQYLITKQLELQQQKVEKEETGTGGYSP